VVTGSGSVAGVARKHRWHGAQRRWRSKRQNGGQRKKISILRKSNGDHQ